MNVLGETLEKEILGQRTCTTDQDIRAGTEYMWVMALKFQQINSRGL